MGDKMNMLSRLLSGQSLREPQTKVEGIDALKSETAVKLAEYMNEKGMSDYEILYVHDTIPWHDIDYGDDTDGFIKELEDTLYLSGKSFDGQGGEFALPALIDGLMTKYELTDEAFWDAHGSVDWHSSSAVGTQGFVAEIEFVAKREFFKSSDNELC